MVSAKGGQRFIKENRAPRVHIEYEVETYGSRQKIELPFVMGVMSDLSGKSLVEKKPQAERDFLEFDMDNFDERMERIGPALEAIVAGRWGLIPFAALEEIRAEGPVDLRDLVWLPVELRFREGGTAAALLPARYPGTEEEADAELRLARRTVWREEDGALRGLGQRVWTTSAGDDIGILSFRSIRFATPA
jgi:protein involved in temperature-dependent protein secretion